MATSTTKSQRIIIWVIAAMMVLGSVGFYFLIILQNNQMAEEQAQLQKQLQQNQPKPLPGYEAKQFNAESVKKLTTETLKEGEGKKVSKDATVTVNYMGWLPSGELFDSSNRSGAPKPIELTLSQVIKGWQKGILGMKVGEVRKLVIPAELAYGDQGTSGIPPNTPLAFIVEVVKVENK